MREVEKSAGRPRLWLYALAAAIGLTLAPAYMNATPDLGVWSGAATDADAARRTATEFLVRRTGRAAPADPLICLETTYQDSLTGTLHEKLSDAEIARRMRERRWPLVMRRFTWIRKDGGVGASVGVTPAREIAWYLDAQTFLEGRNAPPPDREALRVKAEQFLADAGLDASAFEPPQIESVSQLENATEVRWRRTASESDGLSQTVVVRFVGDGVWFFQNRITNAGTGPKFSFSIGQAMPLLAGIPNIILLCVVAWRLWRVARRQKLLWSAGLALGVVATGCAFFNMTGSIGFTFEKSVFPETLIVIARPEAMAEVTGTAAALVRMTPNLIVFGFLSVWAGLAAAIAVIAIAQMETESGRNVSELLRATLALRHAPRRKLAEALMTGGAVGLLLLGVAGALRSVGHPGSIAAAGDGFQLIATAWSPELYLASGCLRMAVQNAIVGAALAWLLLTVRFGVSKKIAAVIVGVWGGVECESGFQTLLFIDAAFSWSAFVGNALTFLVAAFLLERRGAWTAALALWTYHFGEAVLLAAALPDLGVSPSVMAALGLAPLASLGLAWRAPGAQDAGALTPTLLDRYVEEQRYERQLATAARIQTEFLPKTTPTLAGWDIAARSLPAREVGGDFYDFIALNDGKIGLLVGDISGKSVPGALFMVVATTAFRSEAEESEAECAPLLARLNQLLYADMKRARMFAAAAYAVLDPETGALTLANAGLPQPFLHCAAEGRGEYLDLNGLPLGSRRMSAYAEATIVMRPSDILILASDGVVEALNEAEEPFGYEALQALIQKRATASASELAEEIFSAVREFTGEAEQSDDITVLIVKCERAARLIGETDGKPVHVATTNPASYNAPRNFQETK
jgi:serine phosphatase RsbU (regulator of sigma subunit)